MTTPRDNPGIIRFFVSHPNASNLLMIVMIIFGIVGLSKINAQFFPTMDIPNITIGFSWPGASAEDVESSILEAVEPELRDLDGIDSMESYSREGTGTVVIEFEDGTDMQKALSDTESIVGRVTIFPADMEDPSIARSVPYENVAQISLSGPFPEAALRAFARDMRNGLIAAGIDRVTYSGLRDEEILISVPERELYRIDLNIAEIAQRIRSTTQDLPSGTLEGDIEKQVRALSESESLEAFRDVEIVSRATGEKIKLRDVADVTTRFDPEAPISFEGGHQAVRLNVQRSVSSDTLKSAAIVDAFLEAVRPTLPPTLVVETSDVRAELLTQRILLLVKNGASGLALVLIVLFMFLNWRIAFWVAMGIPVAFMTTLGLMWVTGQTINMISLFALIMTLGIVVDDAIVVGENTATHAEMGDLPIAAAENGAGRVMWPVIAAILTTQVAFFPLLLIGDRIGQIMSALPFVVIVVLTASLIECLLILPGHLRHAVPRGPQQAGWFRRRFDRGFNWFREVPFGSIVALTYHWRYTTVAVSAGAFIIAFGVIQSGKVGFQFFPSPESERIRVNVVFAAGTPRDAALDALKTIEGTLGPVERKLLEEAGAAPVEAPAAGWMERLPPQVHSVLERIPDLFESDDPEAEERSEAELDRDRLVRSVYTQLGRSGRSRGDEFAQISVQLTPSENRTVRTNTIIAAWRKALPKIAGAERIAIGGGRFGPPGRDIDVRLLNAPPAVLKQAAEEVAALLETFPGISGVEDNLPYGKSEIVLELTPRGASLGFTIEDVGRQVRNGIEGAIAKRFARGEDEVIVRVQSERIGSGIQALRDMILRSPAGEEVLLPEIVSMREKRGFSLIQRRNGMPAVSVTGDVDQDIVTNSALVAALRDGPIQEIASKYDIGYEFSGREEERQKSFADLGVGLMIALSTMYVLLAWVFASYTRPLAIMLIIPFGFVGAVLGHMVMGFDLTILSMFGLLGLAGILVNDSIILVSRIDQRIEDGQSLETAAIGASKDRFRAVLLTSLTTVGGLGPLLFETSRQAQFLLPMAITIVFGLGVATVFVLFLVPALVGIGGDIGRVFRPVGRWYFGSRRPSGAIPAE